MPCVRGCCAHTWRRSPPWCVGVGVVALSRRRCLGIGAIVFRCTCHPRLGDAKSCHHVHCKHHTSRCARVFFIVGHRREGLGEPSTHASDLATAVCSARCGKPNPAGMARGHSPCVLGRSEVCTACERQPVAGGGGATFSIHGCVHCCYSLAAATSRRRLALLALSCATPWVAYRGSGPVRSICGEQTLYDEPRSRRERWVGGLVGGVGSVGSVDEREMGGVV